MNFDRHLHSLGLGTVGLRLAFFLWLAFLASTAHAALDLLITESDGESVRIEITSTDAASICIPFQEGVGVKTIAGRIFSQPLNSEIGEDAEYLIAARQGGGVYIYLPYFASTDKCGSTSFTIKARHILWNGRWHTVSLKVPATAVAGQAVFFTNEDSPRLVNDIYIDPHIPSATAERLQTAFRTITTFYKSAFGVDPLKDVGVVVAISNNKGGYSGFGGDSLNIVRMSYDNPRPENMVELDSVFPATFAHELAHKLQGEFLFSIPQGRYISEGSADFIKMVVLFNSGLINLKDAKSRVVKALTECSKFANSDSILSKIEKRSLNYREPYDCGMVYYFIAYYSSGLPDSDFMATLLKALSGAASYSDRPESLCLLFETHCRNARLKGIAGEKSLFEAQSKWLISQLDSRPFPSIK